MRHWKIYWIIFSSCIREFFIKWRSIKKAVNYLTFSTITHYLKKDLIQLPYLFKKEHEENVPFTVPTEPWGFRIPSQPPRSHQNELQASWRHSQCHSSQKVQTCWNLFDSQVANSFFLHFSHTILRKTPSSRQSHPLYFPHEPQSSHLPSQSPHPTTKKSTSKSKNSHVAIYHINGAYGLSGSKPKLVTSISAAEFDTYLTFLDFFTNPFKIVTSIILLKQWSTPFTLALFTKCPNPTPVLQNPTPEAH